MVRVVVAEAESVTRQAIRATVAQAGHEVVAEAADGLDAVHRALELRPDLLVLELHMRRLNGIQVIRRLRRELPELRIIVLTVHDGRHMASLCARLGVAGFLSKNGDLGDLVFALKAVSRGASWFPSLATLAERPEDGALARLSPRELSVLSRLASGSRIREIAEELVLSESTISTYKARLLQKLNASSVVELAEIVRRNRQLGDEDAWDRAAEWSLGNDPLRVLLDAIPSALTVRDTQGRVLFANRYLHELLRERVERLFDGTFRDHAQVFGLSAAQGEEIEQLIEASVRSGQAYRSEAVAFLCGEEKAVLHWGAPISEGGAVKAVVCGSIDLTEHERLIMALRDRVAQGEADARIRAQLLLSFGADLAGPLDQASARLAQMPPDASGRAALDAIRESIELARARLQQFELLVAPVFERDVNNPPERCRPAALIASTVARIAAANPKIAFVLEDAAADESEVWLDRLHFTQLLTLMLDLAARRTDEDRVTVKLTQTRRSRGVTELCVQLVGAHIGAGERDEHDRLTVLACERIAADLEGELELAADMHLKLWLPCIAGKRSQ